MNSQSRSAEMELLLCCARVHLHEKTLERIEVLLQQPIDWESLIRTALRHEVGPLVYTNLRRICWKAIPGNSVAELQRNFLANVQNSFFLTAELLKLLTLFETHGISAVPFKGPLLAASVYGDVSLRQFSDLDILVHKADTVRAGSLLVSQGYRSGSDYGDRDNENVAYLGPKFYTFVHANRRVRVDLQWRVAETYFSFSLDKESLWERLARVSVAGEAVPTFAPMDLLLVLCVHGSKHRWEKLKWICDVAEAVRVYKEEIDWGRIQQEAYRQGAERMLTLGLFLAHEFLETVLPEEVSKKVLANLGIKSVAQQVNQRLLAEVNEPPGDVKKVIFYLRTKDRWQDRLQFCFRYLSQYLYAVVTPTSKERSVLPLPTPFFLLYYFFRPLRLTAKYVRLGVMRLYKRKETEKRFAA
jgi:Uncharacterised nucleotidyltransferase